MTTASDNAVEELVNRYGDASLHKDGALYVTEHVVCKSNAGYYVGTWCIEIICEQWLPRPYSRDSGYMTEAQAEKLLASWRE